ncbi:MAG: aminotransferase class I/II-fold pyridoxal phosphate-dependent enzyme [Rhizobiaceae bacterium]|nr:aminotransferase class I/II-fold pyridoxal phosphate-dependent enzyme [Hyphomicrobiales bacterium]NRB30723.1 aminotransferase class I/II-fold pyridoxal phosphate-dependent enzyme [Rhizobiaceae bacterium]
MSRHKNLTSLDTLFAQANGAIDPQTGGVVPPIQSSTTFVRDEDNVPLSPDHIYGRDDNDLVRLGEQMLAKAEHAEDGLLFPSGMAAVAAVMRTVPNGGRIIQQSGIYWGATKWTREFCERREIDLIEVDCADLDALRSVAKDADILWIETPSNPYLKTVDIRGCAEIAKSIGADLVVDSTAATPVLSQPLDHGADIVMHSATKAINGHSDVLAGFLACKNESAKRWEMIKTDRQGAGAVMGSFEAWLLIRGMRTLPLRVERMSDSALQIAEFLAQHPNVENVLYPGLPSDPGHALATTQMTGGFGGLLSVQVKGGGDAALAAIGKLNLFKRATSLGGVESLVEHRHTIEATVPKNLLRLSVGIENPIDLIADLDQAIS